MRLVGGATGAEGRVELMVGGEWRTVCDESWDLLDADVACRHLDLGYALVAVVDAGFGPGTASIWSTRLNCDGSEASLMDCPRVAGASCQHSQDAGVVCSNASKCVCVCVCVYVRMCDCVWDMCMHVHANMCVVYSCMFTQHNTVGIQRIQLLALLKLQKIHCATSRAPELETHMRYLSMLVFHLLSLPTNCEKSLMESSWLCTYTMGRGGGEK